MKLLTRELLAQLEQVHIPSCRRLRYQHRGERSSLRKGSSLEFSDYREYLPGDDIRSIDWNVYARTDRLFLKLFLEDESKPVYFVVDASESMGFGDPTKFEYARAFALALSYVSLMNYDRPRILVVRNESFQTLAITSLPHFFSTVRQMENSIIGGQTRWSSALKKIALSNFPKGIYFLLSDFYSLDGWDGMKLLAAAGNELALFTNADRRRNRPLLPWRFTIDRFGNARTFGSLDHSFRIEALSGPFAGDAGSFEKNGVSQLCLLLRDSYFDSFANADRKRPP